ncbi:Hypothetical_protein [Hexamita inflata]|uniref:Hypothetical_protein n=1 Tax=Hexamita inflata TaxID=28002 RepID=A0AA86Q8W4_9EUKA|nr:Hypothetical protein HINF_LOCUS42081 [Hexamita inflata]
MVFIQLVQCFIKSLPATVRLNIFKAAACWLPITRSPGARRAMVRIFQFSNFTYLTPENPTFGNQVRFVSLIKHLREFASQQNKHLSQFTVIIQRIYYLRDFSPVFQLMNTRMVNILNIFIPESDTSGINRFAKKSFEKYFRGFYRLESSKQLVCQFAPSQIMIGSSSELQFNSELQSSSFVSVPKINRPN